jgi:opacity protein-like surface antigen
LEHHTLKTLWIYVTLAALLTTASVSAGTFKDGPLAGYVFAGDVEDPGLALGWQAGYEFNRYASLEFLFSWHEDETRERLGFDVFSFALNGRVGFVPHPTTRVYGGAGVGYYVLQADNEQVRIEATANNPEGLDFAEIRFDKDFGGNLVAGAEVRLTERWELLGELRYTFFDTDVRYQSAATGSNTMVREVNSFPYDFAMIRIGLNYRF